MLGEESVSWWRDIVARVPAPPTRPAYDDIIADPTGALWLRSAVAANWRGRIEAVGSLPLPYLTRCCNSV